MNIPEKIKIGGFDYKIKYEKNLHRDHSSSGMSCGNAQIITFDPENSEQLQETTLLHEILEQIKYMYNIEITHHQIFQLEAGIYQVLKDNKLAFWGVSD